MSTFAAVSEILLWYGCKADREKGNTGKYQSGQMGQTVNLLAYAFGGSNPSLPTNLRKQV